MRAYSTERLNLSISGCAGWFYFHYSEDSCGFEHVFVGEAKYGKEIMGLHNWVQFYLQEKHDHVDYKGYKARDNKDTVRN